MENSNLRCVSFHLKTAPNSEVYLSGSFNHWNGAAEKMTDSTDRGEYYIAHMLPPGTYEYKFVVNGEYRSDPECPDSVVNEFGTLNSVIHVE